MTTLEKIIARCEAADACLPKFKKLVACQNLQEVWLVLADNMRWVFENDILDIKDWRELLDTEVDCTVLDNYAICWASLYSHLKVVKLLLKHGVDCTADDNYVIRWASENGHIKIVKLLLEHGADCTAMNNYAIRWASYNGHTKIVELLKQHGATL